jgi:hypothetical protein
MDFEMEDQIRYRAYEIWESEGHPDGRSLEHWDRAARELSLAASAPVVAAMIETATIEDTVEPVAAQAPAKTKARAPKAKAPVKPQRKSARLGQVTLN